ncbi:MAG: hypothetical protein IPH26_18755 [Sterolibacteriaceae bacterium]|uniref:HTH luxR-type domain-containing protein n=1 Tax=Candidatus Methylophosphatis roskildensis TaxID=2899263 RepID=A0A9D7HSQ8_9PROT|nr:hypothetical protein [Candidatus Methylophosphatis roskildensis]
MPLHLSASLPARSNELAKVATRQVTPSIETLFDVIQVCEISLGVVSGHQFEAWVRGPLNSLIPHFGLLVWTRGPHRASADPEVLEVESNWPGLAQLARIDIVRFASKASRLWLEADRTPLLLNGSCEGFNLCSRFPDGGKILIHGVDLLFGREGSLFALMCDSTQDFANVLSIVQLISPYLQLAVHRIRESANRPKFGAPVASSRASALSLSSREIQILESVRDGKSNAEIGHALNISPYTVKNHLQRTFRKLEVSTRTQAVAMALSLKLLDQARHCIAVT